MLYGFGKGSRRHLLGDCCAGPSCSSLIVVGSILYRWPSTSLVVSLLLALTSFQISSLLKLFGTSPLSSRSLAKLGPECKFSTPSCLEPQKFSFAVFDLTLDPIQGGAKNSKRSSLLRKFLTGVR